ncbi:hypothetical protein ES703_40925 [subsurface metagenome]
MELGNVRAFSQQLVVPGVEHGSLDCFLNLSNKEQD